ncbi:hypothetical protein LCGC14_1564350, partial [marine sediment metagenome]
MVDIGRTKSLGRLRDFVGVDTTLKQNGDRWVGLCPFHKERTPSFHVFIGDDECERYHCFGCSATGDVLDYVMETQGVDFKAAAEIITADGGNTRPSRKPTKPHDPYEGITPISPVPDGVPAIKPNRRVKVWNPKRERYTNYTPHAVHPYKTAEGLWGYVLRMEMDDGRKITPQIMWCRRKGVDDEWSHYTFPKPRAPYGIERLKKQKQVVVVEGEKTADAARKLLGLV